MMKQMKYYLALRKQMRHLTMQNSFVPKTDGTKYNFNTFAPPLKFVEQIYNQKITLDEAKEDHDKLEKLIMRLENYGAQKGKMKEEKKKSQNVQ